MTGGVTTMQGIEPLANHRLRMPVRTGRPRRIGGLADAFESPSYATSVGLILWGLRQGAQTGMSHDLPKLARRGEDSEERQSFLAKWLKGFLPHG
jgi:cell division protein FtsA